jgi:hypothetical protein
MPRGVAQTVARLVWDQEVVGSSPAAPTVGNPPGSFSADGRQHVWVAPGRASSPGQAIGVGGLELLAKPGPGVRAGRGHCRLLEVGRASTRMTRWSFFVRTPRGSSYTTSVDTKLANSRFESQNRQTPIALAFKRRSRRRCPRTLRNRRTCQTRSCTRSSQQEASLPCR